MQIQQLLKTHALEVAYERCLFQSELIYEEEKARQLRLNLILLEDNNDELQEQLLIEDRRNGDLETSMEDVQNRLEAVQSEAERLRSDLRMKNREVENLKVKPAVHYKDVALIRPGRARFPPSSIDGLDKAVNREAFAFARAG